LVELFSVPRQKKAVGVAYEPRIERRRHYFNVRLAEQFDAVIHIDVTGVLEPLPWRS